MYNTVYIYIKYKNISYKNKNIIFNDKPLLKIIVKADKIRYE
jgi:hypothetical protein